MVTKVTGFQVICPAEDLLYKECQDLAAFDESFLQLQDSWKMSDFKKAALSGWKHCAGQCLSMDEGSRAQDVIFTRESAAKQTAGESWLQYLLQVHRGNSH